MTNKLWGMLVLASVTACTGDKSPADAPAADSLLAVPAVDSGKPPQADSVVRQADSIMVRDTAKAL